MRPEQRPYRFSFRSCGWAPFGIPVDCGHRASEGSAGFSRAGQLLLCWNIQENRAQTAFEPCGDHSKDNSQEGIWLLLFCWLTASTEDTLSQLASEGCGHPMSAAQSIQKTPCWDGSPFLLHHGNPM